MGMGLATIMAAIAALGWCLLRLLVKLCANFDFVVLCVSPDICLLLLRFQPAAAAAAVALFSSSLVLFLFSIFFVRCYPSNALSIADSLTYICVWLSQGTISLIYLSICEPTYISSVAGFLQAKTESELEVELELELKSESEAQS